MRGKKRTFFMTLSSPLCVLKKRKRRRQDISFVFVSHFRKKERGKEEEEKKDKRSNSERHFGLRRVCYASFDRMIIKVGLGRPPLFLLLLYYTITLYGRV